MDEPYDAAANQVAAAAAQLELALRSGQVGSIALARLNLGATLAATGDHNSAVEEFTALLEYLRLAGKDDERELQRRLRMLSPSAPPPGAQDVDLDTVATVTRITLAESLLILGRRDEARTELDHATPGTRGFGRGQLRKRLAAVRRRMDDATTVGSTQRADAPDVSGQPGQRDPVGPAEQVSAADELLGAGRLNEAARVALAAIAACSAHDTHTRAQGRQVLGMALDGMGQIADAQSVLRDSYADYLAAEDFDAATAIAIAVAWRLTDAGDRAGAIDFLTGARRAVEGRGDAAGRVQLLVDLGSIQDQDNRTAEARATLEAAVTTAETTGDQVVAADARHGLAIVLATHHAEDAVDDAVEALSILDECRRTYDGAGLPDRAVGCDHEAAALLGRLGSWDAAAARYERALAGYRDLSPEQRDTGSWPDEVADCQLNLAALAADRDTMSSDPRLFRSGGHAMSHG